MELGNRIKQHRTAHGWSQDDLAEKVYVSRQTISNWENNKSYPDLQSLLLLGSLFGLSLDQLVKGDIEIMQKVINQQDIHAVHRSAVWMTVFMVLAAISAVPLAEVGLGWVLPAPGGVAGLVGARPVLPAVWRGSVLRPAHRKDQKAVRCPDLSGGCRLSGGQDPR